MSRSTGYRRQQAKVFSRFVTGSILAHEENGELAAKLTRGTYERHGIQPG